MAARNDFAADAAENGFAIEATHALARVVLAALLPTAMTIQVRYLTVAIAIAIAPRSRVTPMRMVGKDINGATQTER